MSPLLLPVSLWFLLCIFSCAKSSVGLQSILIDSCFVHSCNFGVPVGGDKFQVFLLHHLGPGLQFKDGYVEMKYDCTYLNYTI